MHHLTELHSVLQDDTNPILSMYTDGGPDNRTNFVFVQQSIVSLFLKEDRDMVVAVRTPPYNSWKDPAERVMATLNLGAQAVGLMRTSTDIEDLLKGCNGLKSIRLLDENNPGANVREKILESTQGCKNLLSSVFERLVYSGEPLRSFNPATEEEINVLWSEITKIDPSLSPSDSTTATISKKEVFMNFYNTHCKSRHYLFSVKKCLDVNCKFHLPPRMENFAELAHLPDPVPIGEHYEAFQNIYRKETSEKYRPSLNDKAKKDKKIPFNPTKQTALNVGDTITCEECGKPRLLHSEKTVKDKESVAKFLEHITYSCGASLQNILDEEIIGQVFVRADLSCGEKIEIPYYSAKYKDICINCGCMNDLELKDEVYPLCDTCKRKGIKPTKRRGRQFKPKN